MDSNAITEHVPPFGTLNAIRNYGFGEQEVGVMSAITIKGGKPADGAATVVYVSETLNVGDVTFAKAEPFMDSCGSNSSYPVT